MERNVRIFQDAKKTATKVFHVVKVNLIVWVKPLPARRKVGIITVIERLLAVLSVSV